MNGTATSPSITPLFCGSNCEKNPSLVALAWGVTSHWVLVIDICLDGGAYAELAVNDLAGRTGALVPPILPPVPCCCKGATAPPAYCCLSGLAGPVLFLTTGLTGAGGGGGRPPEAVSYTPGGRTAGRTSAGFAMQLWMRCMPMIKSVRSREPRPCVSAKFLRQQVRAYRFDICCDSYLPDLSELFIAQSTLDENVPRLVAGDQAVGRSGTGKEPGEFCSVGRYELGQGGSGGVRRERLGRGLGGDGRFGTLVKCGERPGCIVS